MVTSSLEQFLSDSQPAKEIVTRLVELFSIAGDDGLAFSRRLELRQEIRELLVDLDCSGDL